jgi:hypothetical protein
MHHPDGHFMILVRTHNRELSIRLEAPISEPLILPDLFDPVGALQVHQIVAQSAKCVCVATVTFLLQVLADQIEHGGEGAEVVLLFDMELQACFVLPEVWRRRVKGFPK